MRFEFILPEGDLRREVWVFSLGLSHSVNCIYFDHYSFQTRLSTQHRKWTQQTHWTRLNKRDNNIDKPPLPIEVEKKTREYFKGEIDNLPIQT